MRRDLWRAMRPAVWRQVVKTSHSKIFNGMWRQTTVYWLIAEPYTQIRHLFGAFISESIEFCNDPIHIIFFSILNFNFGFCLQGWPIDDIYGTADHVRHIRPSIGYEIQWRNLLVFVGEFNHRNCTSHASKDQPRGRRWTTIPAKLLGESACRGVRSAWINGNSRMPRRG